MAFDPEKAAQVTVVHRKTLDFLDETFLRDVQKEKRGVGVFLPTRAAVEDVAGFVQRRFPRINAAFYHGGEPIRIIRPFLEGDVRKPYLLSMTAAGQSALNVHGLDTVVIEDMRFTNLIEGGKNVLTRVHLGANEILQMAGRVHGRVAGGRVFILSDRDIRFKALRPTGARVPARRRFRARRAHLRRAGRARRRARAAGAARPRVVPAGGANCSRSRGIIENGRLSHVRRGGGSAARGSRVGGAARARERGARAVRLHHGVDRIAAPHDA